MFPILTDNDGPLKLGKLPKLVGHIRNKARHFSTLLL